MGSIKSHSNYRAKTVFVHKYPQLSIIGYSSTQVSKLMPHNIPKGRHGCTWFPSGFCRLRDRCLTNNRLLVRLACHLHATRVDLAGRIGNLSVDRRPHLERRPFFGSCAPDMPCTSCGASSPCRRNEHHTAGASPRRVTGGTLSSSSAGG